jgi:hypothetical protein
MANVFGTKWGKAKVRKSEKSDRKTTVFKL